MEEVKGGVTVEPPVWTYKSNQRFSKIPSCTLDITYLRKLFEILSNINKEAAQIELPNVEKWYEHSSVKPSKEEIEKIAEDENLKITFVSVVEDSRCSIGMKSFAEGNAEVLLILYYDGYEIETALNTNVQPRSVLFKDYQITLKRLVPYPIHQKIIFHGCYTATFVVKRMRAKTYS